MLPLVKLGSLAFRTLSKPIAARLKHNAGIHPKFRGFIIGIAQVIDTLIFFSRTAICALMLGFDAWISFCLPWRNSFLRLQLLLFLWNLASWGLLDRFFFLEYGFAASFPRFRSSLEWRIVLTMTWTVAFDRVRDTCGMDFLIIVF